MPLGVSQSSFLEGCDLPVKLEDGGVGERLNPAVLKTVRPERVSGVRIPPPPPFSRNQIACCPSLRHSSFFQFLDGFLIIAKFFQPLIRVLRKFRSRRGRQGR